MSSKEEYKYDGKVFYSKAAAQQYLDEKKEAKFSDRIFLYFIGSFVLSFLASTFFASRTWYPVNFKYIAFSSLKFSVLTVASVLIFRFISSKFTQIKANIKSPSDDKIAKAYEQALLELESGNFIKSTMAMAIERSKGDDNKVKSLYISLRTKDLLS